MGRWWATGFRARDSSTLENTRSADPVFFERDERTSSMADEADYWYVRDGKGGVSGPFSRSELDAQRARGILTWSNDISKDRVFWVSASSLPPVERGGLLKGEKRGRSGPLGPSRSGRVPVAVCLGLWWVFGSGQEPDAVDETAIEKPSVPEPAPAPATTTLPSPVSRAIRSAEAVSELSSAVGFVVCGRTYRSVDGTKTEIPTETGTCFAGLRPKGICSRIDT